MAEVLKLKLIRQEVPVELEDEAGNAKKFKLIELSGAERNTYLNQMKDRVKTDKSGNTTVKNFNGFQADLLERSLFDIETGEMVAADEIEDLPASTQQTLFERSQKLSGLDSDSADTEGND